jgi:catechol 2,3-dioxygenase
MAAESINPEIRIGHVHLKVSDIERSLQFYRDVLGFQVTQWYGRSVVFLSSGGIDGDHAYHHHIALNTWESRGGSAPPPGSTGLYHFAILYPTRAALADAYRRVSDARIPLTGMADHGVSLALYLNDPDGNGVELYWDRPLAEWPLDGQGQLAMYTQALDLGSLLAK